MQFRLITYNIHRGIGGVDRRYRPERVIAALARCRPDVVLLQEVDEGARHSRRHRQVDLLGDALELHHLPLLSPARHRLNLHLNADDACGQDRLGLELYQRRLLSGQGGGSLGGHDGLTAVGRADLPGDFHGVGRGLRLGMEIGARRAGTNQAGQNTENTHDDHAGADAFHWLLLRKYL